MNMLCHHINVTLYCGMVTLVNSVTMVMSMCFRLRELEDQKASWETEREELVRARRDKEKETTETLSR